MDVKEIERLDVKDGEVLVIKIPENSSRENYEQVKRVFEEVFGKKGIEVKVIIMSRSIEMSVVSKSDMVDRNRWGDDELIAEAIRLGCLYYSESQLFTKNGKEFTLAFLRDSFFGSCWSFEEIFEFVEKGRKE